MKKILSLALALLIVASTVAMTSCKNRNDNPEDPDTETPGTTDPAEIVFTDVEERAKVTVTVEIRLDPAMDVDNVIGQLRVGEIVTRTGISADGTWSRVRVTPAGFEENEYYVSTNCLALYTGTEDPEDPENPVDPEDPENPVDPENPDDPADPENPTDPEDPEDPENPVDPETPAFTPVDAYVWADPFINVRSQPTSVSTKLTTVSFGTKVQCVEKDGDWIKIVYGEVTGYVHSTYLTLRDVTAADFVSYAEPKSMVVNTDSLYVRYYPFSEDINGNIVDSYEAIFDAVIKGDTVTVTGASADHKWARIQWADGKSYYVYAKYLSGFAGGPTTPSEPTTPNEPTIEFESFDNPVFYTPVQMSVRYYETPNTWTTAKGTLAKGNLVEVVAISKDGEWLKIKIEGTVYYALAALLEEPRK